MARKELSRAGSKSLASDKKTARSPIAPQPDDPNRPIALRLVPFVTGWSVAETLAALHERQRDRYYLLIAYEYDPKTGAEREARPELYRSIAKKLNGQKFSEENQLRALPHYHFVRAGALRGAFYDYVSNIVGREEASEAGLRLVWNPATGPFRALVAEAPNFAEVLGKPLGRQAQRQAETDARHDKWQRMVDRVVTDRPDVDHRRACQIVAVELERIGEPVEAETIRRCTMLSKA